MGGMRWQGSASYYRTMNRQVRFRLGGDHSVRIILDSLDYDCIANPPGDNRVESVAAILAEPGKRLERAGADIVVVACNTVHRLAPAKTAALRERRSERSGRRGVRVELRSLDQALVPRPWT